MPAALPRLPRRLHFHPLGNLVSPCLFFPWGPSQVLVDIGTSAAVLEQLKAAAEGIIKANPKVWGGVGEGAAHRCRRRSSCARASQGAPACVAVPRCKAHS